MKKIYLNKKDMKDFMDVLDNPPEPNEPFKKLMSTPAPWEKMSRSEKEDGRISISDFDDYVGIGEQFVIENIVHMDWTLPDNFDLELYQEQNRFYLDEYPNQEKLRKEWFKKTNEYKDWIKAFMTFASAGFSVSDFYIKKPKNVYDHFVARFNKRN